MAQQIILETQRLILREFVESDAAAYYALGSDPEVNRFSGSLRLASLEHALEVLRSHPLADYHKYGFGRWACMLKASDEFVGFAGLKYLDDLAEVDVGFCLSPAVWGRGLASEAGRASLTYGFDRLGLKSIIGLVDPANIASVRVLEKLGMSCAGLVQYKSDQVRKYVITIADHFRTAAGTR